jgi:hypothetical protein
MSRLNREYGFLAVGLILFIVVPFIVWTLDHSHLNNSLVWLTGVVVLIYTNETYRLRLQMVRQNDISVKPFVVAVMKGKPYERQIFLKNIGRGAALFVWVGDVGLGEVVGQVADLRELVKPDVATFSKYNFIEAGNEQFLEALCGTPTIANSKYLDFTPSLDPDTAKQNYKVTINYQDVDGRDYQTKMQIGKDGIALIGASGFRLCN